MFEIIFIIIAFIILILASLSDMKSREVPDYLSYFMIILAIAMRIIWFLFDRNIDIIFWAPISFGIFFLFSYLMYRAGQWGGGDVKIMMGLSILLSWFYFDKDLPFFIDFFFNSLIVGAVYGVIAIFFIGIINFKKIKKYFSYFDYILIPSIIISVTLLFALLPLVVAIIIAMVVISIGMIRYFKIIEENLLRQKTSVDKLTEGDWLTNEVKLNGKTIVGKREIGLIKEDIQKLKKLAVQGKLKTVMIRIGVPFVPSFLFTLIITLLFGNLLLQMISLGIKLF